MLYRLENAQLATSPVEEVLALYNEYVLALAECLLKGGDDPDTPAGKRLVRTSYWLKRYKTCKP